MIGQRYYKNAQQLDDAYFCIPWTTCGYVKEMPSEPRSGNMNDIDDKVYRYTLDYSVQAGMTIDPPALHEGIRRHMASARTVVTTETLERVGHVHLSLMINTAARYGLSLGEVLMEAVRNGSQPVASLCDAIVARKGSLRKTVTPIPGHIPPKKGRPTLRLV